MESPCCSPSRGRPDSGPSFSPDLISVNSSSRSGMLRLDGGLFLMGAEGPETWPVDGEGPVRETVLAPFWIDEVAVTNADFAAFAKATSYITEAETFGWSFVPGCQLSENAKKTSRPVPGLDWWYGVERAWWRQPLGDGPDFEQLGLEDHPVVHVSWNDASAFACWAGKRLPTEAEWEFAARGGLEQKVYPWGDELFLDGAHRCNIWQGDFPEQDTAEDGFCGTAPVRAFPPNGHGLYQITGNVWEWVEDRFDPDYGRRAPRENPTGPERGSRRVMRGGSFLCHASYCNRYRCSARSSNTPDASAAHLGFRCAKDVF